MADSAASGYNPGASMLNTNPDASLKVFMGGGGGADGGAGAAYNDTASLLRTVPGAELQKFDGGAMRVPGAEGQGRLLQDVLGVQDVRKDYEEKNNVIRSLDDLRGAFREPGRYNEFIDWLGGKLLNNDLFKKFVAERMLTISAKETAPRAKRRTTQQIIKDKLDKTDAQIELTIKQLNSYKSQQAEAENLLISLEQRSVVGEELTQAKNKRDKLITESKKLEGVLKDAQAQQKVLAEVVNDGEEGEDVKSATPTVPAAQKLEIAVSDTAAADGTSSQGTTAIPGPPPVADKGSAASEEKVDGKITPLVEGMNQVTPKPEGSVKNESQNPYKQNLGILGGARKAKRTLKSRPLKGRNTLKRK
jgi:hypothetical protein